MIDNKLQFYQTRAGYDAQAEAGNIPNDALVFVKETHEIITHGEEDFGNSDKYGDIAYLGDQAGTAVTPEFNPQDDTVWTKDQVLSDDKKDTVQANILNKVAGDGMGKVVLKRNIVSGVNTLTQDMFYKTEGNTRVPNTNTIFVIKYDFTLGENITIPENCILEFDGGSISGEHTITGQNTSIKAGLVKMFNTDVTLTGTWNVAEAYPEWFGAKGDGISDDTIAIQRAINLANISSRRVCKLLSNKYKITSISVPSSLEIAGTFSRNRNSELKQTILCLYGNDGNHITLGDAAYIHDLAIIQPEIVDEPLTNGEWLENQIKNNYSNFCIYCNTSHYIRIENITFILVANGIGFTSVHENAYINNIVGVALVKGLYMAQSWDVDRIKDVHLNANYLSNGSLIQSQDIIKAVQKYTYKYGKALIYDRLDGGIIDNFFCYGYNTGIEATAIEGSDFVNLSNSSLDGCYICVLNNHGLLDINNCVFTAFDTYNLGISLQCAIRSNSPSNLQTKINNCTFFACQYRTIEGSNIIINNCVFKSTTRKASNSIDIVLNGGINLVENNIFNMEQQYGNTQAIHNNGGYLMLVGNVFKAHPNPAGGYVINTDNGITRGGKNVAINDDMTPQADSQRKLDVIVSERGTTAKRPSDGSIYSYFDTDLNKPLWLKDNLTWVDATGATV